MSVIANNILSMNAARQYGLVTGEKKKITERLSSGYKINRASDDACSLTISEKLRSQIRGLKQGRDNITDGISYCNVADGALSEVGDMIHRIKELSIKAANGTNTSADRIAIDTEVQEIGKEIDRVFKSTEFNTKKIWPAEMVPMVSGNAQDCTLYSVKDATGEYYGGISYMNHRYSWADLGIGFDSSTHNFTQTKNFVIDSSILKDDGSTTVDDYDGSAEFILSTVAGQTADTLKKNYSWKADNDGIRIDGVLAKGNTTNGEGDSRWAAMGIVPGDIVKAGEYGFTYYGQNVFFELDEDMPWSEFQESINNTGKGGELEVEWYSTVIGTTLSSSVTNISSDVSKIYINSSTDASRYSTTYNIDATAEGIKVTTATASTGLTSWSDLGSSDGSSIGSWGTDVNSNAASKSDKIGSGDSNNGSLYTTTSENSKYTYESNFMPTDSASGKIEISFNIQDDQSGSEIVQDIDGVQFVQTSYSSPVVFESSNKSAEVYVKKSASDNISIITQRDLLGRPYNSTTESIAKNIDIDIATSGRITMNVGTATFTSTKTLSQYYNNDSIYSNAVSIGNKVTKEYDSAVNKKRAESYNALFDATNNFDKLDSYSSGTYNVLNNYITSDFDAGYFGQLFDYNKLNSIFGTTDFLDTDSDAERANKANNKWNALSDADKINLFKNDADIASKKNEIWNHDFKTGSNAGINKEKVKAYLHDYAELKDSGMGYRYLDRNVLGISDDDKVSIYKTVRNNHLSDSVGAPSSMNVEFAQGSDRATLTFDMSNITYGDLISKRTDSQLKAYISRLNYQMNGVSDSNEAVTNGKTGVYNVVSGAFDNALVDLSANGTTYQNVSMVQRSNNQGTQVINYPEVVSDKTRVKLNIHAGPQSDNQIQISYDNMRLATLGIKGMHCDTEENARVLMDYVDIALDKVSRERSEFGAYTNRLEHAYNIDYNIEENTQAAESLIRDTDMADAMVEYSKLSILEQVGQAMIAQANQSNQGVLNLLQ